MLYLNDENFLLFLPDRGVVKNKWVNSLNGWSNVLDLWFNPLVFIIENKMFTCHVFCGVYLSHHTANTTHCTNLEL